MNNPLDDLNELEYSELSLYRTIILWGVRVFFVVGLILTSFAAECYFAGTPMSISLGVLTSAMIVAILHLLRQLMSLKALIVNDIKKRFPNKN